jgi:hypothetical protein
MVPLIAVLVLGGVSLVYALSRKLLARAFGSDLLAGSSIVTFVSFYSSADFFRLAGLFQRNESVKNHSVLFILPHHGSLRKKSLSG